MFDIVTNLISERKIPALDELQMEALLHHLFTATPRDIRIQVAEVACRYDREHPRAMDVFLASALPLAEPTARRRAARIFVHPSDLQIELMYGGAVEAVIAVFQSKCALKPEEDAFRRYLLRAMVLGAVRAYFRREENAASARQPISRLSQTRNGFLGMRLRTRSSPGNCWTG